MTAEFKCANSYTTLINLIDNIRQPTLDKIYLGLDLRAYGYISPNPNATVPEMRVEMRKGYVTLSSSGNKLTKTLGGVSTHCLSFDSPNGFSGGPLLMIPNSPNIEIHNQPLGVIFNNLESETVGYEITEIEDKGQKFKEIKRRITMYGVFHSLEDIKKSL